MKMSEDQSTLWVVTGAASGIGAALTRGVRQVGERVLALDVNEAAGTRLAEQTGAPTSPQIYIGGEHVGGCTELFDAVRDGRAAELMAAANVDYDRDADVDPYDLLPKWLHPRQQAAG